MAFLNRLVEWVRGRKSGRDRGPARYRVGRRGEREAVRHLKRRGYTILERNFRVPRGEIDVIAFRDGVVVFVEVRSVTGPARLDPRLTVGRTKRRRIVRAAGTYASRHGLEHEDVGRRFDVVTIIFPPADGAPVINHVPGAFEAE